MSQNQNPQIIIIGAGISGIAAAFKLISSGFNDVTILEAENRIGGRIDSRLFGEGFIDFGAQWCSGEKGNSVFEMCHDKFEFGCTGFYDPNGFVCLASNGKHVDDSAFMKLASLREEIAEMHDDMRASTTSIGEFFEQKYNEALGSSEFDDVDSETRKMTLALWHNEVKANYAAPSWYDISAKYYPMNKICEGSQDLTWKTFGYKTIFDIVEKQFVPYGTVSLRDKLILNKKVTCINWKVNKSIIETADRSVYQADHVIITIPLGALQNCYKSMFIPSLPERKVKAIECIKVGTLGKVFLEFEEPFWKHLNENFKVCAFLWAKEDLDEIMGTDKEWLINVYGFLHLDGYPNVLETLLSGNKMQEFETYSDEKIENDCMWMLEKFFGKKLPRPIAMRRTRWLTRENFLGSYSYLSLNSAANDITPKDLKESIKSDYGKPMLLFAGEATSADFQGYVHGALDTGRDAAQELIDYYEKKK